jgi:hypothetical protein
MESVPRRGMWRYCSLCLLIILGGLSALAQSTGGRIVGHVADPSGAAIPDSLVTITQEATNTNHTARTDHAGDYSLLEVPVGDYTIEFDAAGFESALLHHVRLTVNQVLTVNQTLSVGATREIVEVSAEEALVDVTSTQLGAVVDDRAVVELPLNSRDTYQFLQLQPGVQSQLGGNGSLFFGSDRAGVVSVNGGRGRSNNYSVNGGDGNDLFANLPAIQPSPDSIQEFRVLTNTFDAEYGRNSGAVVNVVTKSGGNEWHGSGYEFFRNTVLNARNYFESTTPQFNQNQFGSTFGGPIKKDATFFFLSYEGRRIRQGVSTGLVTVPTDAERNGDFSQTAPFDGSLNSGYLASVLQSRPGCAAAASLPDPAAVAGSSNGVPWSQIFPGGVIPKACMDQTALDLMNSYVPTANYSASQYQGTPVKSIDGDQVTARIDHRINSQQNLSFYYYFDNSTTFQPLSFFQQAGANVPGFGSYFPERDQQYNLSHTWALGTTAVNELRFNYFREGERGSNGQGFMSPQSTGAIQSYCKTVPSGQCFSDPSDPALGITTGLDPAHQGLPDIQLAGGFTIGNNFEAQLPQVGNSFQWTESYARTMGPHTVKVGADIRRMRFDQMLYYNVNGYYQYNGGPNSVSGESVLPDYLLGLPSNYSQGSAQSEAVRNTALYLFAQDSWKMKQNLTFNYGLRWELDTPLADVSHHVQTFRPGEETTVFGCDAATDSCAGGANNPLGLVFPGDPGVPNGLTQTYYNAFAPRLGLAWSPSASDNWLAKLTGGAGRSSIRAGFGMFYNPMEQLVLEQFGAGPPFGGASQVSQGLFNTPWVGQNGTITPNPFTGILSPTPGQAIDWSQFRPILMYGDFQPQMRTQYSTQYNLTLSRELGKSTVLQVGYVGSQGHRLLATHDLNYGSAQTCLGLNAISTANGGGCGPYGEDSSYFIQPGTVIPAGGLYLPYGPNGPTTLPAGYTVGANGITLVGLRRYSSPNCNPMTGQGCPPDGVPVFSSIFAEDTVGNSAYNSLQASLERRFSRGLRLQAAYTFSKSIDDSSSFENILNPLNSQANRALSLFDARQRFVVNYDWQLPVPHMAGVRGKLFDGWTISGITTAQSGFPIAISSSADMELEGSDGFQYPGEPAMTGAFRILNPRTSGGYYFDTSVFTDAAPGTFGNSPRTICCGPGMLNFDMAFLKNTALTEKLNTELRVEIFNLFNHTQFYNPDGNISDGSDFGMIKQARDPRLVQVALKLSF